MTLFILSIIAVVSCASSKPEKHSEDIVIEYSAMTRGSNKKVVVKHDTVATEEFGRKKTSQVTVITKEDWKMLMNELEKVNLDDMENLKAPTDKRLYDGALIATLTVIYKDKTYRSNSFDHGHPPAEIAPVVNKVLALSALDKEEN